MKKYFKSILLFVIIFVWSIDISNCLFEDQIGKFDWRKQFLGQVNQVYLDPPAGRLVVATKQHALASLSIRNGDIVWREVFEKTEAGRILSLSTSGGLVSVSQDGELARVWEPGTGVLLQESSLPPPPCLTCPTLHSSTVGPDGQIQLVTVYLGETDLRVNVAYVPVASASEPNPESNSAAPSASVRSSPPLPAPWLSQASCELVTRDFLICATPDSLYLLPIVNSGSIIHIPLQSLGLRMLPEKPRILTLATQRTMDQPIFGLQSADGSLHLLHIQPPGIKVLKTLPPASHLTSAVVDDQYYFVTVQKTDIDYRITFIDPDSWEISADLDGGFELAADHGELEQVHLLPYVKKDKGYSYKVLVTSSDHAILLYHQLGKLLWCREESLASIITAEMVDLPLSETDANIEKEFGHANGSSVVEMFATRITTQLLQLQNSLVAALETLQTQGAPRSPSGVSTPSSLTRDRFGLHKLLLVATAAGKVFGLDSLSGEVVWSHLVPQLEPFPQSGKYLLFVQRTTAFFPHPAVVTLLGHAKGSDHSYLYSMDPITGRTIESRTLDYQVIQASLLGHTDPATHLRPAVLLDSDLKVHIYPESGRALMEEHKDSHYLFTADLETGVVQGYSLASFPHSSTAMKIWNINFPPSTQTIVKVTTKRPNEHVHSQGRVMGDRSVLYKYINPNLAIIITEGTDFALKTNLNIYLVDVVTGNIVYASSHKRAKGPVHVVHAENWAVYSYFNERSRRVEVSAIELYEGPQQSNSTAFSSLLAPPHPLVEHQTFIFPAGIDAMADTLTERGLTNKHILIALPGGGIVEVPRLFLDPRRPIYPTNEHREEGLIPYLPELTIPSEGIVNYNQSVVYVRGLHTAASGLESTCLVFVYGLDIYFTRVTPSKTFDILKDDFDHYLISAVLVALTAVSLITKRLASLKALWQAWK